MCDDLPKSALSAIYFFAFEVVVKQLPAFILTPHKLASQTEQFVKRTTVAI